MTFAESRKKNTKNPLVWLFARGLDSVQPFNYSRGNTISKKLFLTVILVEPCSLTCAFINQATIYVEEMRVI